MLKLSIPLLFGAIVLFLAGCCTTAVLLLFKHRRWQPPDPADPDAIVRDLRLIESDPDTPYAVFKSIGVANSVIGYFEDYGEKFHIIDEYQNELRQDALAIAEGILANAPKTFWHALCRRKANSETLKHFRFDCEDLRLSFSQFVSSSFLKLKTLR
jgi:hypothetical protein